LTFDHLTSKSIGNIFLPWVIYMCDMVTLGGKDNGVEPGNQCVYRRMDGRTDGQPDSSIPPHNFVAGGIKKHPIVFKSGS
jgi:hypothetical protein